ncbi:MAG: hypothetical protein A2233_03005 [Candidatus Kerfeldbacteria bacterium RIFOXYA2_FULL_38_24]|uniref:Helix-turn-helix type 11 domain-containing protein n=1 Tax=Candidatus Kerfeldbacteria bacterium RIFOXYB2_FULL_38_14 TaxID=1798547 RepID=A0A1G2BCL7_9BACT|nr:MAG: hypothetical protein A2233_03005 [Candidatus Kerfeldbacteria bacterium RIFOXYA2_FULL_38_24]OGY86466.1 MAG: hypothetical protein A2319_03120 [Candidatus Kerfeldbacteria bacterium RIFOXYB2_FULL_38_14]OGY88325.1 MAG: hypothetical protein A2458_01475 [Candidatus Kerfeldbacteria bacterium RIFOXYC2_FULL_38_9]
MLVNTDEKIVDFIASKKQVTAKQIVEYLEISKQATFRHLAKLLAEGRIVKIGKPPKVIYRISEAELPTEVVVHIDADIQDSIEKEYLYTSPTGEMKEGWRGFVAWCEKTNQPVSKTACEYVSTLKKYDVYKKNGFIVGTEKFKKTFPTVFLNEIFYVDFYSIERFGKTKLGQLLLYAKQSQNKQLIKRLVQTIQSKVTWLIQHYNIDGVGFIPPTVKREVQLMNELRTQLHLKQRLVSLTKITGDIAVPQKTLSKLEDRIENARKTIIVTEQAHFQNILLIDDAVGSGATLNETAAQIRGKNICEQKIIGLSLTGSFKGFDVISEV